MREGEIFSPLDLYRSELKDAFRQAAEECFDRLVKQSGVDASANEETVSRYRALLAEAASVRSRRTRIGCLMVVVILLFIGGGVAAGLFYADKFGADQQECALFGGLGGSILMLVPLLAWLAPRFCSLGQRAENLEAQAEAEKQRAWEQMEPLNCLYEWDMPAQLMSQVIPGLHFDRFCGAGRLAELRQSFDYREPDLDENSVLAVVSGDYRGNPFAIVRHLCQEWSTQTYYGSKTIHWTERVRDSEGKSRTVTRSETLTASVTKPIPVYEEENRLVFGHEAAPNLSFTRHPSDLSDAGDGWFGKLRKRHAANKLKKFSRNLDDESQYTMMGNEEFETLFNTMDRDNEVEFRLLYTPLAQTEVLKLLKDGKEGYGDDFMVQKARRCNIVVAQHLDGAEINADPTLFRNFDLKDAHVKFVEFSCEYFRMFHFAMAPLMAIPMYQEKRGLYDMNRDDEASSWEDEALVNYYGEERFKSPQSITRNILKTNVVQRRNGVGVMQVTAHGFRGVDRCDSQRMMGGDGKMHTVDVHWVEYLPVTRTSTMGKAEQPSWSQEHYASPAEQRAQEWRDFFRSLGRTPESARMRRDMIAFYE